MTDGEQSYRVLARKYRPRTFDELVGQDALVRTLSNAIKGGRLAHAFLLTGVRGVGKTTTARIIARCLNCVGPEGDGGPTPAPCGKCEHCLAITEDRHVDVIEMDAASRTGVADIRELIEGVRYRPVNARYKVYIIDEVHMLSTAAFNALLKTLEEPPPHVIFVFATTEIRKVPVTVLSRCQRFDLRRIASEALKSHLAGIVRAEAIEAEEEALALIARAADGSVRDALSLLDQAIAHGAGKVALPEVRAMLGLADRNQLFDLFDALMRGDLDAALKLLAELYAVGADPLIVLQDLLELTHWLTRLKVTPEAGDELAVAEPERVRGRAIAEKLTVPRLSLSWQMLLKGVGEARNAPSALDAVEMTLIRLAHAAELPSPAEVIRRLEGGVPDAAPAVTLDAPIGTSSGGPPLSASPRTPDGPHTAGPRAAGPHAAGPRAAGPRAAGPRAALAAMPEAQSSLPMPSSLAEVVELAAAKREMRLYSHLLEDIRLVSFEPGRIEFNPGAGAPRELASLLAEKLKAWTGERWVAVVSQEEGEPSLSEQTRAESAREKAEVAELPLVRAVLDLFPGATIGEIHKGTAHTSSSHREGDDGR
jgi:DNA polymerase-3 subunit gamma/tau